eukprot:TRINITY_DN55617_c0_g1_i1.p1 TRINITY_DN55617_c0_g1~~TRINITY_DN55617_c0_g1_i1.p1  ORF type:complete len:442 (-),score=21.46 TRINITY_DN55617_c0_g1_i1:161-1486(-)
MGHRFSKILPLENPEIDTPEHDAALYIGPIEYVVHDSVLPQLGIKAVVSLLAPGAASPRVSDVLKRHGIENDHLVFPLEDTREVFISLFSGMGILSVLEWIHQKRLESKPVLVHCDAGFTRSACVATAYIMKFGTELHKPCMMKYREALQVVKRKRGSKVDVRLFEHELLHLECQLHAGPLASSSVGSRFYPHLHQLSPSIQSLPLLFGDEDPCCLEHIVASSPALQMPPRSRRHGALVPFQQKSEPLSVPKSSPVSLMPGFGSLTETIPSPPSPPVVLRLPLKTRRLNGVLEHSPVPETPRSRPESARSNNSTCSDGARSVPSPSPRGPDGSGPPSPTHGHRSASPGVAFLLPACTAAPFPLSPLPSSIASPGAVLSACFQSSQPGPVPIPDFHRPLSIGGRPTVFVPLSSPRCNALPLSPDPVSPALSPPSTLPAPVSA